MLVGLPRARKGGQNKVTRREFLPGMISCLVLICFSRSIPAGFINTFLKLANGTLVSYVWLIWPICSGNRVLLRGTFNLLQIWGHAVSEDLVHWEHLPPALEPTEGWVDADGCFSGCCIQDETGKPMILYTGVRLRSNHEGGQLPPTDQDLGMVWIESQCAAVPEDPTDELLRKWKKIEMPFLKLPPKGLELTGWRDPFICQMDHQSTLQDRNSQYTMLIGSGIKGKGGTALVYKSKSLEDGWILEGLLCEGCADDTGVVWECPLLVPLSKLPQHLKAPNRRTAPIWLTKSRTIAEKLSSADLARTNTLDQRRVGGQGQFKAFGSFGARSLQRQDSTRRVNSSKSSSSSDFNFANIPGADRMPSAELFHAGKKENNGTAVSLLAQKLEEVAKLRDDPKELYNDNSKSKDTSLIDTEDKFEAAKARVKPLVVKKEAEKGLKDPLIGIKVNEVQDRACPWYFFTVSPDAPTNPVLYWTGHVNDASGSGGPYPKFCMETAKGPYRLDLGDILYAPNVCQDDQGRWLLWGWLQERRKVGSYAYSGCLTLPRVLHVTEEGRLIQAPIPELEKLRNDRRFHAQHITLRSNNVFPIKQVRGERLDIQCSIDRGSACAAGLVFRSHEAEAEGSTAIVYDWINNQLEAIFNVPPNWHPPDIITPTFSAGRRHSEDASGPFDPASMLCTPRFSVSKNSSFQVCFVYLKPIKQIKRYQIFGLLILILNAMQNFYPIDGRSPTPISATETDSPISSRSSKDLDHYEQNALKRSGSSLSMCLNKTNSVTNFGSFKPGSFLGGETQPMPKIGSLLSTSRMGSFINKSPSLLNLRVSEAEDPLEDEDLGTLLEDLAAPMRTEAENEAQHASSEPRRVGGPLLMQPDDVLHLRIIVDHSCLEVYAGTGEVLSTRIYRGRSPDPNDPGIEFLSFGGSAILENVSAYEITSAWPNKVPTPTVQKTEQNSSRTSFEKSASAINEYVYDSCNPVRISREQSHALFDEILSGVSLE